MKNRNKNKQLSNKETQIKNKLIRRKKKNQLNLQYVKSVTKPIQMSNVNLVKLNIIMNAFLKKNKKKLKSKDFAQIASN